MVVMALPPTLSIVVMQDRVAGPSTCTVQAPHNPSPQPNLVPVMPSTSRSTHSRGVSPSTSTLCGVPLTLIVRLMATSRLKTCEVSGLHNALTGDARLSHIPVTRLGSIDPRDRIQSRPAREAS